MRWDPNDICWHKVRHCRRCTTEVVRFYSQTGARLPGGGYTYAEGYQNKGKGRLTGSDLDALRLESFTRHAEDPMPLITRK